MLVENRLLISTKLKKNKMKNKKLENIVDNVMEWIPIAGVYCAFDNIGDDRETLVNKNDLFKGINGGYQGVSVGLYILSMIYL